MPIKNIVFDFGGVLAELDRECCIRRFEEIGLKDASSYIDDCLQKGIFQKVEDGTITGEEFVHNISQLCSRDVTYDEVYWAYMGIIKGGTDETVKELLRLRKKYRLILLSNINPFVMSWARSPLFSSYGKPVEDYFDDVFASYEVGGLKPGNLIFDTMLSRTGIVPEETIYIDDSKANIAKGSEYGLRTLLAFNGKPWKDELDIMLGKPDTDKGKV